MPQTEPVRLDLDGSPVAAWSFGGPDGAPLVIGVHDFTGNGLWFGDLAARCAEDVRFVAPDLRGRGGSLGAPPAATLGTHVTDIDALVEVLGTDRSIIVGHGTGCAVALEYASTHPARTQAVVLLDGPPIVRSDPETDWVGSAGLVDPGAGRVTCTYPDQRSVFTDGIASGRLPAQGLSRALRRAVDAEIAGSGFAWRIRSNATTLEHDWELLADWSPPTIRDVPIIAFHTAHGHHEDQQPIALHPIVEDAIVLDVSHTGLLADRDALGSIAESLISSLPV